MITFSNNLTSIAEPSEIIDNPHIYVAIPVMDEPVLLDRTLDCLSRQSYPAFTVFICVNQPEYYHAIPEKQAVCKNNETVLISLARRNDPRLRILDRSSPGRGWMGKNQGVGFARKTIMDAISNVSGNNDIIVSLDADTTFSHNYLTSIARSFKQNPGQVAISTPYFHRISDDEIVSRAMLRYEIYMRHYFLSLVRIGSPYAFTALGSAMAVPLWAYRAIGGMTPRLSGEDFYFLQKLRKYGPVQIWLDERVFPEARFSDRVFFGTGPALIKGATGDWTSYPVYGDVFFREILLTYLNLPLMHHETINTDVIRFMSALSGEPDPLESLRRNHKDSGRFVRAFHEKFDGLRILQYLKLKNQTLSNTDEERLCEFLELHYTDLEYYHEWKPLTENLSFANSPLGQLERIRKFLYKREMEQRLSSALQ